MQTPTIVKQTRDYMLIKIPLPKEGDSRAAPVPKNGQMSTAEKKLWRRLQEAERDVKAGRIITARSVDEALKKYAKRQWG